jgi:hypothetical protein
MFTSADWSKVITLLVWIISHQPSIFFSQKQTSHQCFSPGINKHQQSATNQMNKLN